MWQKVFDHVAHLAKTEKELARFRERIVQLGKDLENRLRLAGQAKQNHEEDVVGLRKDLVILENEMGQQIKDFTAKREHCYNLLNQLEGNVIDIQN